MYNCKHLYNIFISASCEHLNVTEANSLGEECGDWRVAERVRIGRMVPVLGWKEQTWLGKETAAYYRR